MAANAFNPSGELSRRSMTESDIGFLRELFATTRGDIAGSGFGEDHIRMLMDSQFNAQHHHYQKYFPNAAFDIICRGNTPIGRIYVDIKEGETSEREIRLIDISLMPEHRNRGTGSRLISELIEMSRQKSIPVRLRVEPWNPALHLYRRLGFQVIADEQANLHMEWSDKRTGKGKPNHETTT